MRSRPVVLSYSTVRTSCRQSTACTEFPSFPSSQLSCGGSSTEMIPVTYVHVCTPSSVYVQASSYVAPNQSACSQSCRRVNSVFVLTNQTSTHSTTITKPTPTSILVPSLLLDDAENSRSFMRCDAMRHLGGLICRWCARGKGRHSACCRVTLRL